MGCRASSCVDVLTCCVVMCILLCSLSGCGDEEMDAGTGMIAILLETIPASGGAMPPNGEVTLVFDFPPESVVVNGVLADINGNRATFSPWFGIGTSFFLAGMDPQFHGELESGIVPEPLRQAWEQKTGKLLSPSARVTRTCCDWRLSQGYTITMSSDGAYHVSASILGTQTYDIAWENRNGSEGEGSTIALILTGVDCAPQLVDGADVPISVLRDVLSASSASLACRPIGLIGCGVKNYERGVDPELLNREGIRFQFSEPIEQGSVKIQVQGGDSLSWSSEWEEDAVTLLPTPGNELKPSASYIVSFDVQSTLGKHSTDCSQITFTTRDEQ